MLGAILQSGIAVEGADTSLYQVLKGMKFTQSDANLPTLNGTNGFPFEAEVYPANQGTVTNAFVKVAGSNLWTQLTLTSSQSRYEFKKSKNTITALNSSYPNGTYQFQIYGINDGVVGPSLNLLGDAYPAPPHIIDFAAIQAVNPNGYSVIRWDTFSSGTGGDFERITIEDPTGNQPLQSPNMDKENALSGLTTYTLVGPGILTTGQSYTVTLDFVKNVMVDRTSYPGALGAAGYFAETKLPLLTTTAAAPDVDVLEITKGTQWVQTNSGPAALDSAGGFRFQASIKAYQPNLVSGGAVTFPANTNAPSHGLTPQPDLVTLAFSGTASTSSALEGAYPGGNYALSFTTTHDGSKTITIPLSSVTNAPTGPHVSNFDSLQAINAARSLTVSWDRWVSAGPEDFIQLQIADSAGNLIFATSQPGQPKALNGGATNTVIAAQTLIPGQVYRATLVFKRISFLDTAAYPAVLDLGDYESQTGFAMSTVPSDVSSYSVVKGQVFSQSSAAAPVLLSTNGHVFTSQVIAAASNSVMSSAVTTPLATVKTLSLEPESLFWVFSESQPTQTELDASYPYGNYTLELNCAHDGLKNLVLALPAAAYPNAPHLTNFDAAQVINSSADFVLAWDAFGGTALNGFIQLTITDSAGNTVFKTPDYGLAGALTGLATAATIPAGVLAVNQDYQGTLQFESLELVDTATYPGSTGISALSASTRFSLGTKTVGKTPVLNISIDQSTAVVQITATVVAQQTYRLDGASSFPASWLPLATNTASSSSLIFLDSIPAGRPQFFYRLVLMP